mmetsp:Transcript_22323/g.44299  ORF Transcript_22323/g.44299 Transcript_22323/m.44299 type:complete len:134 (+) Transcript_22323:89-490(+)
MAIGQIGRPHCFLKHFNFLTTYFGRGMTEILVGVTVILMNEKSLFALACGAFSTCMGVFGVGLSCPCCGITGGYDAAHSRRGRQEYDPIAPGSTNGEDSFMDENNVEEESVSYHSTGAWDNPNKAKGKYNPFD